MVRRGTGCAAAFVVFLSCASAQEGFDSSRVSADVRATGAYTDNFYYGTGDEPREAGFGVIVSPGAAYKATKGRFDVLATVAGDLATFSTESADGYEDARAGVNTSWLAARRGRL